MTVAMETQHLPAVRVLSAPTQSKKTEAMPKHTLFGTALEVFDPEEREAIKNIDLETHRVPSGRKYIQRYMVPEFVKNHLKGKRLFIEKTKKDIEKQKSAVESARKSLQEREEEAKKFEMDVYEGMRDGDPTPRQKILMTMEASNMLKEMNRVGLNERNSYNRDKYGRKPSVHSYSLMGDVMRPRNMDLPSRRENSNYSQHKKEKIETVLPLGPQDSNQSANGSRPASRRSLAVDLPENIRHQFGSKICESLLNDEKVVERTMQKQKEDKEAAYRVRKPLSVPTIDKNLKPEYEQLGNFMRMNVFPGYNVNHKISTTKSTFTDSVHLQRVPDPDKWRYQRDELSTWAEFNILNERMKKSWNDYFTNLPKAEANWNRNAAPKPKPAPNPTKQKPVKKKPTQKQENPAKPEFEEVVFETPPITPPPDQGTVKLAPTKDNEFWDFYDKGGKK
ncbi:uncharacterized protein LOC133190472 isoform X1 [Saccostrea echinata]|uniref:uncharacterized protein LOC133190472 isoform X1 n=1 Tax=Saccostrea echinata TaxID=191078 RepID=UPI002A8179BB|nr:uncharacterized protein LOC133190472 isoform X1 [Saccostrea echinata]